VGELALYYINSAFTIINNIFADNNSTGADSPLIHTRSSKGLFAHNTMANNSVDYAILVGSVSKSSIDEIGLVNNIIVGHPVGIYVGDGTKISAESTLWGDLTQTDGTGTITTAHDYTGDPDFKNDYHIGSNSAAKDRAAATSINLDIDGDSRPQGDGYDIGADEFVNTFASPALIMYLLN
jgi:hypothetical protein